MIEGALAVAVILAAVALTTGFIVLIAEIADWTDRRGRS